MRFREIYTPSKEIVLLEFRLNSQMKLDQNDIHKHTRSRFLFATRETELF